MTWTNEKQNHVLKQDSALQWFYFSLNYSFKIMQAQLKYQYNGFKKHHTLKKIIHDESKVYMEK